jgi:hypothetical protein
MDCPAASYLNYIGGDSHRCLCQFCRLPIALKRKLASSKCSANYPHLSNPALSDDAAQGSDMRAVFSALSSVKGLFRRGSSVRVITTEVFQRDRVLVEVGFKSLLVKCWEFCRRHHLLLPPQTPGHVAG